MRLVERVIEMVVQRKKATAEDILPELEKEGYTRAQVIKSLQYARYTKRLKGGGHTPRRGFGTGRGSACSSYEPADDLDHVPRSAPVVCTAPSSVWEYAQLQKDQVGNPFAGLIQHA